MSGSSTGLPADPGERTVGLLRRLIRNACINNGISCNETVSASLLQAHFAEYGLEAELLARVPGRDNLVLRIPGTDPAAPSLAFMGHTDVVPAEDADWQHPPFAAEISGKEVWGRGTLDMLNMVAAQAVGIAEAWKLNGPFPGDLLFIAPADEEASGNCGARWLTENHWDKVACDYMVSEIGGYYLTGHRGSRAAVGVGEKGVAWLRISTAGTPGHGSMPFHSRNAVTPLFEIGRRLSRLRFPFGNSRLYRGMASASAAGGFEELLLKLPGFNRFGLSRLASRSPGAARSLHAVSRTTANIGVVRGGSKINMIPDAASLDLDIRILPGETLDNLLQRIRSSILSVDHGAEIEVLEYFPPTISPQDTPLMRSSAELLKEHRPDAELLPVLMSGATDGRFWRSRNTTVYGFTVHGDEVSMDYFSTLIHGRDERVSLAGLERSRDYFTRLPELFFRHWRDEQNKSG